MLQAEANAQRESLALQSAEKEKFKLLQDQKKLLEEQLTRVSNYNGNIIQTVDIIGVLPECRRS